MKKEIIDTFVCNGVVLTSYTNTLQHDGWLDSPFVADGYSDLPMLNVNGKDYGLLSVTYDGNGHRVYQLKEVNEG